MKGTFIQDELPWHMLWGCSYFMHTSLVHREIILFAKAKCSKISQLHPSSISHPYPLTGLPFLVITVHQEDEYEMKSTLQQC